MVSIGALMMTAPGVSCRSMKEDECHGAESTCAATLRRLALESMEGG
jgi:hypothetical protein